MNKGFILINLFILSFLLFNYEETSFDQYDKIIILSDFSLYPSSNGTLDVNSLEGSSTTLIYELKDNFDPNTIRNSFESEYGEINNQNVDFAISYFQDGLALHYLELKQDFMSKSGYPLSDENLLSSSPYIIMELDYVVSNKNDLEQYYIDLALNSNIYQLAVISPLGGLPFTEIDLGGGGGSSCESNKFIDVKNAIQYVEYEVWNDDIDDWEILSGNEINIAIVESKLNTGTGFGLVEKDYYLNEGLSNEINVFGSRVHWHPIYDENAYALASTHPTNVAHIAAGYNGLAYKSNIFSVDYRDGMDIYSQVGYNTSGYGYIPISSYLLNVRPDYATAQLANIVNISAGLRVLNGNDTTTMNSLNKIYNSYIYAHQMIFVASAGNYSNEYVNAPSSASNVFSVGGTNNDGDDYYSTTSNGTSFIDLSNGVQKPNIIAPAIIDLSTDTSCDTDPIRGTSYAAPLVTGAIALLLEKEPTLKINPSEVFALLTATSSNHNFPISAENTYDENIGNKSGAGILQINNLLINSQNTFTTSFNASTPPFVEVIENINVQNYYKTLRVALFWMTKIENNTEILNDYTLEVYFNDQLVGISDSDSNNTELVIYNINTNGTLEIRVTRNGTFVGNFNDNVGVAWALTDN